MRHRPAIQKTLRQIASQPQQHVRLRLVLHSLRHRRQPQALPQPDDRRYNLPALTPRQHRLHKAPVHLDLVERQRMKVPQTRVPRPEVINRNPHPQRLQLLRNRTRMFNIPHQSALSNLNRQPLQREARLLRCQTYLPPQRAVPQLDRRHINRQPKILRQALHRAESLHQDLLHQLPDAARPLPPSG